MKIGILTFNWAINYGAVLQMYAEYKYLNKNNEVFIINYVPDNLTALYSTKILDKPLKFKSVVRKMLQKPIKYKQNKKFKEFINKNMILTEEAKNRDDLLKIINKLDLVVVGSDQVWNYDITKGYLKNYLLSDINCSKISYAASLGKNDIRSEFVELFKKSLKDFDFISLREEASIEYLNEICKRGDYKLCIDPVFLLNKEDWETIARKSDYKLPNKEYILIYMLECDTNLTKIAKYLSKIHNIPIISIEIPYLRFKKEMKGIKKLHDVGPIDFVKLFLNSKYILTNSFHGTAFSLIFNKQFISFTHSTVNLRIQNLLKLYGLENNQITDSIKDIDIVKEILENNKKAYYIPNKEVDNIIEVSKKYLDDAIREIANRSK